MQGPFERKSRRLKMHRKALSGSGKRTDAGRPAERNQNYNGFAIFVFTRVNDYAFTCVNETAAHLGGRMGSDESDLACFPLLGCPDYCRPCFVEGLERRDHQDAVESPPFEGGPAV